MDPASIIGLAASVASLAELGARLSVKLFEVSRQIKNANQTYEAISQEVAITGAVLQQLSVELRNPSRHGLFKPTMVTTAMTLADECDGIFNELNAITRPQISSNASTAEKTIADWKHRLKLPHKEAEVDKKREKLERLKASLNVMMNVIILAAQVEQHHKSDDAKQLLLEQAQMLKDLKQGIDLFAFKPPQASDTFINTNAVLPVSPPAYHHGNAGTIAKSTPTIRISPTDAQQIREHARLIRDLSAVVQRSDYNLDSKTRQEMRKGQRALHYARWARLVASIDDLYEVLDGYDDLLDYWSTQDIENATLPKLSSHLSSSDYVIGHMESSSRASRQFLEMRVQASTSMVRVAKAYHFASHNLRRKDSWPLSRPGGIEDHAWTSLDNTFSWWKSQQPFGSGISVHDLTNVFLDLPRTISTKDVNIVLRSLYSNQAEWNEDLRDFLKIAKRLVTANRAEMAANKSFNAIECSSNSVRALQSFLIYCNFKKSDVYKFTKAHCSAGKVTVADFAQFVLTTEKSNEVPAPGLANDSGKLPSGQAAPIHNVLERHFHTPDLTEDDDFMDTAEVVSADNRVYEILGEEIVDISPVPIAMDQTDIYLSDPKLADLEVAMDDTTSVSSRSTVDTDARDDKDGESQQGHSDGGKYDIDDDDIESLLSMFTTAKWNETKRNLFDSEATVRAGNPPST